VEKLARDKHSSLVQKSVNYGCKKFIPKFINYRQKCAITLTPAGKYNKIVL
jgi:hypothetical protein